MLTPGVEKGEQVGNNESDTRLAAIGQEIDAVREQQRIHFFHICRLQSSCPTCRKLQKRLNKLYDEYGKELDNDGTE